MYLKRWHQSAPLSLCMRLENICIELLQDQYGKE